MIVVIIKHLFKDLLKINYNKTVEILFDTHRKYYNMFYDIES